MRFTRTGIVLCTENYQQCVTFYTEVLELPVMFSLDNEHSQLTCCDLGSGNYLMLEKGGKAIQGRKTIHQNPTKLRFNVEDAEAGAQQLSKKGIDVVLRKEVWGTVADFTDPDGNLCSLRDEITFGQ